MEKGTLLFEKPRSRIVPTYVTEEHHHVLKYWINSGLRDADLLHIDGHSDMGDGSGLNGSGLHIANFIAPAVHHGIVTSIYWLNPHSNEWLKDCGTKYDESGRIKLRTKEVDGRIFWDCNSDSDYLQVLGGKLIAPKDIRLRPEKPLILDIDLDAFCCHRMVQGVYHAAYNGVDGFERRIIETANFLRKIKRPNLITITESQGQYPYVPEKLVKEVKRLTMQKICGMYLYK